MPAFCRPRLPAILAEPASCGRLAAAALLALALAGCGTTTPSSVRTARTVVPPVGAGSVRSPFSGPDGPPEHPPAGLESVPDAVPRDELIAVGGANRPYEVFGVSYLPIVDDRPHVERGLASWYGRRFHGRRTSSGEPYDMYAMSAAHRTLPIPSYVRVRNPANGRSVIVRVNDRGPFHSERVIDLSYVAALKLGILRGTTMVEVSRLTREEIRSGSWREAPATTGRETLPLPAALPASSPTAIVAAGTVPPAGAAIDAAATGATTAGVSVLPVLITADLLPVVAVTAPSAAPAASAAAPFAAAGWWVQLGAFRDPAGAEALQRRAAAGLDWLAPLLAVFHGSSVHRLQAGPYASRIEATEMRGRIGAALGLSPLVVERR